MSQSPLQKIYLDHQLRDRFKSELYRIEQPYVQILTEGYTIKSHDDSESFSASRPRRLFRTFLARTLAIAVFLMIFIFCLVKMGMVTKGLDKESPAVTNAALIWGVGGFLVSLVIAWIVSAVAAPLRRATVKDHTGATLIVIEPTSKFLVFNSEFAIRDSSGQVLATFEKDFWESIFQRHWHAYDFQRRYLFSASEDNLLLSILRRYLNLAKFIPMQFKFNKGGGKQFGEFRRGYSLRDKYKLTYDPAAADGFLMVATGILLDTGEKR